MSTYANTLRFLNAFDFGSTSNSYLDHSSVSMRRNYLDPAHSPYMVAGSVWLLPRNPAFKPVSVLRMIESMFEWHTRGRELHT